jgi:hypothetical protein
MMLKMKEHVVSLKHARKLYHLGVILETHYVWVEYESLVYFDDEHHPASYKRKRTTDILSQEQYEALKKQNSITILHTYPAPTVAELGEALPPCSFSQREENGLWGAVSPKHFP